MRQITRQLISIRKHSRDGGRRRRRSQVSHQVHQGDIGLMPHPGDHRDRTLENRTDDFFGIEAPEILK